ncbi:MAG TPA: hypothetical protein VIY28_14155 [Pseudonocardiaceae bacterium]
MDDQDEFPTESIDPPGRAAVRICTLNGWTIIMRTDPTTRLTTLGSEDPEGALVWSRVLDDDDLHRLHEALNTAMAHAEASGTPVVLDVSKVIGRD